MDGSELPTFRITLFGNEQGVAIEQLATEPSAYKTGRNRLVPIQATVL
jgi:hypothetical protein